MSKVIEARWVKTASKVLVGRKIVAARYMSSKEAEDMGWYSRPVVFELDDGTLLYPSQDDEGNNGGALFIHGGASGEDCLPVLRVD